MTRLCVYYQKIKIMDMQNKVPDYIKLLIKFHEGEISDEEKNLLDTWVDASPRNRQLFELLHESSRMRDNLKQMYTYDQQRVWRAICEADRRRSRRRLYRFLPRYAAVGVVLIAAALFLLTDKTAENRTDNHLFSTVITPGSRHAFLQLSDGNVIELGGERVHQQLTEKDNTRIDVRDDVVLFDADASSVSLPLYNTVSVPAGGEMALVLSDGSRVWLNAESSIRFPTKFSGDTREVTITGEAYFEVMHDVEHPFVVMTNGQRVTVLGTSFNLSAYDNDDNIKTTLVTGLVKLEAGGSEVRLLPGQQAQFIPSTGEVSLRTVDAHSYMAWTQGAFVFFDESIDSICRMLARWYQVNIDASAPGLEKLYYSGVIQREDTFNRIADLLASTDELLFVERGDTIVVLPRQKESL
jgi:ferric-dicitrate binding protein FerR (iron transport regulator)